MRRRHKYSSSEIYSMADAGVAEAIAAVKAVNRCTGPGRYQTRQWKPPVIDRQAEARQAEAEKMRLRLRLSLAQRLA